MIEWWGPFVALFSVSLVTALVMTPVARRIAWRVGSVDHPGARRVNKNPTPRMGGIAVFVALLVSCAVAIVLVGRQAGSPGVYGVGVGREVSHLWIAIGLTVVFVTGLLDDYLSLSPKQKLLGQVLGATAAVMGGTVIDVIVNPLTGGGINLGLAAYPLTVLYLVAYTNIFNLIDGLDGLASGIACIASVTMCVISTMAGRFDAAMLALMLAGATLGFLRYNFNPASIFLGDSGSLLVGFALGVVSLLSVSRVAGLTAIIVPLVISGIPIIDTFSAIIRRGRAHVSIGQADKGHIHHRLMAEGLNQRQTVLIIYVWTMALCVGSLVMTQVQVIPRIIIFCVLMAASVLFALRLHLFHPVLLHHYNPITGADELVSPQDPAFRAEEERFEEEHLV